MPHRYQQPPSPLVPFVRLRPFAAVKEKLREGYSLSDFRSDVMAGIVVAMVAIPLGMALAIASGVAPQYGLYTVVIAGSTVALLGGSRFQVTGPTAAFVIILAPIAQQHGFGGLLTAGLMAGILLVLMGVVRMGRFIQFIPYPVTTGFTSGIAVVIATLQLKDFFGLKVERMPEHFIEKVSALFNSRATATWPEFLVGLSTLAILLLWPRINKRIPAPLIALASVSLATALLKRQFPEFDIATIGSRFTYEFNGVVRSGIPQTLPSLHWPWNYIGSGDAPFHLNLQTLRSLVPSAFAIAVLGAIESLLSAVVSDGMTQTKHDPDAELVALGTGNIICPFFGGIAATGAIARTATNIRFGAKSPFSAVVHALLTMVILLAFAPYVSYLPMAALAALLLLVAYNMSELKHFVHILNVAPKGDVIVLLICFGLTVIFDMVVGVTVGVVLAAFLFMQRMSNVTSVALLKETAHPQIKAPLPPDTVFYEITGPLFFGAATSAVDALSGITDRVRRVLFLLEYAPVMDVTGLVALESAIKKLTSHGTEIYLIGARPQPLDIIQKSDLSRNPRVKICKTIEQALTLQS